MRRLAGALVGALIGDALALGCHWYYDIAQMRRECGWITDYQAAQPGHYHAGQKTGASSQSGLLLIHLMRSLAVRRGYDETDFTRRLETLFFPLIDGQPESGPGGYTNQSLRECWHKRVIEHRPWAACAGPADTTEGAERAIALGVFYANRPDIMIQYARAHITLTQNDPAIVAMSLAFNAVLSLLVRGIPFDELISDRLMVEARSGKLPFHTVTDTHFRIRKHLTTNPQQLFASPDALLTPGYIARAAHDPDIRIQPAWKAALVYGLPCAIYHQLPAAYYLAARYQNNFEEAVIQAINGGGQNMSRAMLTGALVGAQTGLDGIPDRWIEGLERKNEILNLVELLEKWASSIQ